MTEEPGEEDSLVGRLVEEAVRNVFDGQFKTREFRDVVEHFETGKPIEVGDLVSADTLLDRLRAIPGFCQRLDALALRMDPQLADQSESDEAGPAVRASTAEFVLEALYCHNRLNKSSRSGQSHYGL